MHIVNPYENVDWSKQQKANFHTHTRLQTINDVRYGSDDGAFYFPDVVNKYHERGYTILAFTDHDWSTASQVTTYPPSLFGVDTEALGMLIIEGKEISWGHHRNSLFCDLGQFWSTDVSASITEIANRGGLAIINHPYIHDNPLEWYVDLFMKHKDTIVGVEVNNAKYEGNSVSLWDQMNTINIPLGKVAYGYGNDDLHHLAQYYHNYNVILSDLNEASVKNAMINGHTYFSNSIEGLSDAPKITNINVTDDTIFIESDSGTVSWITEDSSVVGTGNTFDFSEFDKAFVRAEILSSVGKTYTQPFSFIFDKPIYTSGIRVYHNGVTVDVEIKYYHDGQFIPASVRTY